MLFVLFPNTENLLFHTGTDEIPYADCNLLPGNNILITWHSEFNKSHAKLYDSNFQLKKDELIRQNEEEIEKEK